MADDSTKTSGHVRRTDKGFEGKLTRAIDHAPARVWEFLTTPQGIAQWLAPGTIELKKGGAVHIDFGDSGVVIDSTVLEFEPERILTYSWSGKGEPERPLRWEIDKTENGCTLSLGVRLPADEDIAKACGGFEAHLDMLMAALEGVPVRFPFETYSTARKAYQAELDAGT